MENKNQENKRKRDRDGHIYLFRRFCLGALEKSIVASKFAVEWAEQSTDQTANQPYIFVSTLDKNKKIDGEEASMPGPCKADMFFPISIAT